VSGRLIAGHPVSPALSGEDAVLFFFVRLPRCFLVGVSRVKFRIKLLVLAFRTEILHTLTWSSGRQARRSASPNLRAVAVPVPQNTGTSPATFRKLQVMLEANIFLTSSANFPTTNRPTGVSEQAHFGRIHLIRYRKLKRGPPGPLTRLLQVLQALRQFGCGKKSGERHWIDYASGRPLYSAITAAECNTLGRSLFNLRRFPHESVSGF
jgi:hypothetical protein